jgi:hypothetical protein
MIPLLQLFALKPKSHVGEGEPAIKSVGGENVKIHYDSDP